MPFAFAQQGVPENILKEDAAKDFAANDYHGALGMYKDLLAIQPEDPDYNLKYGICLLYIDSNKSNCIKHLYTAATCPQPQPISFYYLARAFHLNYRLDEAIEYYEKYKGSSDQKNHIKYELDLQIQMCRNGKELMKYPVETDIQGRSSISNKFFTTGYSVLKLDANISFVSNTLKSKIDRKQTDKTTLCIYDNGNSMVYSSYGNSKKNGKDLFRKIQFARGEWSKSQPLGANINSVYDENFPFLPAGDNVLYFSSNGTQSMGGYDIFRSEWDEFTQTWGKPMNIGYPINSPFDDILFVPKAKQQTAYFASDRNSPYGKIEVFKINYLKVITNAVIKGVFEIVNNVEIQRAQITVTDLSNDELVGIYNTSRKNGSYLIALTPGGKYKFTIDVKGFEQQVVTLEVPAMENNYLLKQLIRLQRTSQLEIFKIFNFFSEEEASSFSDKPTEQLLDNHKNVKITEVVRKTLGDPDEDLSQITAKKVKKKKPAITAEIPELPEHKKRQKEADNFLKMGDYNSATKIYYELYTSEPSNPNYNFKMGICAFYSRQDQSTTIKYFERAVSSVHASPEVYYYLGRCHHLSMQFDLAITNYEKYKNLVSIDEIEYKQINRLIKNCINGKMIINQPVRYEIINQKTSSPDLVYYSLNKYEFYGKILITPDDFKSKWDKKMNFKSTMNLTRDNNTVYYASYGEDGKSGKNIYRRTRLFSGGWSDPEYMERINTEYDEDYPFYISTGVLYFSSNRDKSMGGYDIFKSQASADRLRWSTPENMGLPVNSPADDIFFILCKDGGSG